MRVTPALPLALALLAVGAPAASEAKPDVTRLPPPAAHPGDFAWRVYAPADASRPEIAIDRRDRVRLTLAAQRKYRRGDAAVTCEERPKDDVSVGTDGMSAGGPLSIRQLRLELAPGADLCTVWVHVWRGRGYRSTVTKQLGHVALSAAGVEMLRRRELVQVMVLASIPPTLPGMPMTLGEYLESLNGRIRVLKRPIRFVVMGAPDAALAPGQLGVYQQGKRIALATTMPDGTRLYFDHDDATGDTRTNVLEEITALEEDEPFGSEPPSK